jgi:hypothetical protein
MTMRKLINGIGILALLAAAGACNDLTEVNVNPNNPEDVAAKYLMVHAMRETVSQSVSGAISYRNTAVWAQHNAEIQYSDEDRYKFREAAIDAEFRGYYSGPLTNFNKIMRKNESPNHLAISLTLKSYLYQIMTDLWGDIPYSQALQIDAEQPITAPVYDSQKEIYAGLFRDLKEASVMFDASMPTFKAEDLIYGGDLQAWKKFGNSLRLRMAMRLSEVDPGTAQAEFNAALAADGGVFTSNADNAVLIYGTDPFSRHPFYDNNYVQGRDDYGISKTIVDIMTNGDATGQVLTQHDPRLAIYAVQTTWEGDTTASGVRTPTYRGHQNGLDDGHGISLAKLSRIGSRWQKTPNADAVLMSYAEVLFLQAEAAQRGWTGGNAEDLYMRAIEASMEYYGIPAATFSAYMAAHPEWALGYAGSTPLRQIGIQKWIALFTNGPEAFAEWRRTGYPELQPGPDIESAANGKILRRYKYSSLENSLNEKNQAAAVAAQGMPDFADITTPVWWDKKAH